VAFSGRCGPPQPFNSSIHKGLPTRGNPFFFGFGRTWAQNRSQSFRKSHIIFTNYVGVNIKCQRSFAMPYPSLTQL